MSATTIIFQAFGEDANLYTTVLGLQTKNEDEATSQSPTQSQLRKAYYRRALLYHPDKQKKNQTKEQKEEIKLKFQAVSLAYTILSDGDKRRVYDETGEIDDDYEDSTANDNDEEGFGKKSKKGADMWKEFFTSTFGKVTTKNIDQFTQSYKCSEEEEKDVLKYYTMFKGNLDKMLECVMCSDVIDKKRWVQDFIHPAIDEGSVEDYAEELERTLYDNCNRSEKKTNKNKKNKEEDAEEEVFMDKDDEEDDDDDEDDDEDLEQDHDQNENTDEEEDIKGEEEEDDDIDDEATEEEEQSQEEDCIATAIQSDDEDKTETEIDSDGSSVLSSSNDNHKKQKMSPKQSTSKKTSQSKPKPESKTDVTTKLQKKRKPLSQEESKISQSKKKRKEISSVVRSSSSCSSNSSSNNCNAVSDDLIAAIRGNSAARGEQAFGSLMNSLEQRYASSSSKRRKKKKKGSFSHDDIPDDEFDKIQARLMKKKK